MGLRQLVKTVLPAKLLQQALPFWHLFEAFLAQAWFRFPARDMKVIGVTGTDGKSTSCLLIGQMLRSNGKKTAILSTIAVDFGDGRTRPSPRHMTTAGVWQLLKMIKQAKQNRAEWLVLEVSSHALDQHRVWGIPFSVAVLTNISHEHLDYHGSMANYQAAKRRLFEQTNRNLLGLQIGVINADDAACQAFTKAIKHSTTYGINKGEIKAANIKSSASGSSFTVEVYGKQQQIHCRLPGRFNIYNALAAIGVGLAAGLSGPQIAKGIASLLRVPGRLEKLDIKAPFSVYLDYAVTPNALKNSLLAARDLTAVGRVLLVFGATGQRDKSKRPEMGKIAAESADRAYLTDDETYWEDPQKIRDEVKRGSSKLIEIGDRQQAIETALAEARNGDTVLITGLGHQTSRNMGGKDIAWSDAEIVRHSIETLWH